jgi:hypothetical protein
MRRLRNCMKQLMKKEICTQIVLCFMTALDLIRGRSVEASTSTIALRPVSPACRPALFFARGQGGLNQKR